MTIRSKIAEPITYGGIVWRNLIVRKESGMMV